MTRDATTADEFQLIARYFKPLARGVSGASNLMDDAATLVVSPGRSLVVTADMLVADIHFLTDDPPDSIGIKALGVNLSDLAAMGAEPAAYVLTIALPTEWDASSLGQWLAGFTNGLAEMQVRFHVGLLGGDTVSTPGPLSLAITAFGTIETGRELRRSGARPGDIVFVSGTIGDGFIGLCELTGRRVCSLPPSLAEAAVGRYRRPTPQLSLGRALVGLASACADVSDGLIADLEHICEASGVAATINAGRVPLSATGRSVLAHDPRLLSSLLTGGDDYELVFTAPNERSAAIVAAATRAGVPVTGIGVIAERETPDSPSVTVIGSDGHAMNIAQGGWSHF